MDATRHLRIQHGFEKTEYSMYLRWSWYRNLTHPVLISQCREFVSRDISRTNGLSVEMMLIVTVVNIIMMVLVMLMVVVASAICWALIYLVCIA